MKRLPHAVLALLTVGTVLILPGFAAAEDKIKVVATFTVIADMVTNVAGDLVDLVTIVGPDGDADEYEPTVADVPKMANARILFMNGLETVQNVGGYPGQPGGLRPPTALRGNEPPFGAMTTFYRKTLTV